jgi:transcriptional regulator with XRE-family HTH domain
VSTPPPVIGPSLRKALEDSTHRPIPKSAAAQMRALVKAEKGSTRAVAARLGISRRTVERYLKGTITRPRPDLRARLEAEVRRSWQPRVQRRARRRAAASGIAIATRATFGYRAAPGTTDDGRVRQIAVHLPPEYAARLYDALDAGADEAALRRIAADGLGHAYFRDGGRRAQGLDVRYNDIDYADFTI